ncbi:transcription termination factor Rho [Nocardia otitidiscaviarum]|uniref:transcription termination factor Rho n=1 Tax=Nocardia otitidiscaviarum TaxID=1823 RepID=UPI001893C8B3|nr:transcription termination factor Rho [Nocardia otitidiscaviarum]MBF6487242.1 transcription termination factor Rho [Nocardia otitidiscaviarum]
MNNNTSQQPSETGRTVSGILDSTDQHAGLRVRGYLPDAADIHVPNRLIRETQLRRGDFVTGIAAPPSGNGKYDRLTAVTAVNGQDPRQAAHRPRFADLTPIHPNQRLRLETEPHELTTRVTDLVMPIGKGQRALIVAPPKAGKTSVLQSIAHGIAKNHPECELMLVLVGERPEEVTDLARSVPADIAAATFDRAPREHVALAELAIEHAKRLAETGRDVVVLLDSLTRLARAYNLAAPSSGRVLSGGVDAAALAHPKRFLGAARNFEEGGSLTIVATALVEEVTLRAEPQTVDLAGVRARTWSYGPLPASEIRVRKGETLRAEVINDLPAPTTVHWHGIALRNDMDGVPDMTQAPIAPGSSFRYEFTVPDAGTYFFHPHVGVQLDRGLYGPLIVEDPADGSDYDLEAVVVLDDWLDGVDGRDPDQELRRLRDAGMAGMGMGGGGHGGMGETSMDGMGMGGDPNLPLGADGGDVEYPYYLLNGRVGDDPVTFTGRPGQRMRLRIVNAGSDTAFRVAVGGHRLRITHSDGFRVQPVTTDSVLVGMGERYDAIIDLADGVFPLVAGAEGKTGQAFALIRTGGGSPPPPNIRPAELNSPPLTADALSAAEAVRPARRIPDRILDVVLGSDMREYTWTVNGKAFPDTDPLEVTEGERVRLRFVNRTMMAHPMHLHGHTYQVVTSTGTGPRKDTSLVLPMRTVEVDFDANNPGRWMTHCHNIYHGEAGMMAELSYVE